MNEEKVFNYLTNFDIVTDLIVSFCVLAFNIIELNKSYK